jgi:metal-responsive CopG/Arc/MetJ family transcriptional regulator
MMKRIDVYITKKQYDFVKDIADYDGITFSEMFRKIIDKYKEQYDNKQNEQKRVRKKNKN